MPIPSVSPPITLHGPNGPFEMRAYSKFELRNRYGESVSTFRQYYLKDEATLAELITVGYRQDCKHLTRKMVQIIVNHHGVP